MIMIDDKSKCCGCSACASICPKQCIQMKPDDEGFLYPIVDTDNCISCDLCVNICPSINSVSSETALNGVLTGYVVQNKDKDILKESTSGGFFTSIAKYVICNNGVIFGAMYDDSLKIIHGKVHNLKDLYKLRNSKYTQSDLNSSFKDCKRLLEKNILVCFSGTPCQIAGLKTYLNKEYDNLITIDVICRGVSSPLLFKKYIDWNGGKERIANIKFRDKFYGYYSSTMSVYRKNGEIIRRTTDPLLKFYFKDLSSRPSCYSCAFKTEERVSDFTMFDSWHAGSYSSDFDNEPGGATAVLLRSKKALQIFKDIKNDFIVKEEPPDKLVANDGIMMLNCVTENPKRTEFFVDLKSGISVSLLWEKYGDTTPKARLKNIIKDMMIKIGIFDRYMINKFENF